jgi:transcriptional regulator with XRE-family HTH domain
MEYAERVSLGKRVKRARVELDLSQNELLMLSKADFTQSTLSQIENGKPVAESNLMQVHERILPFLEEQLARVLDSSSHPSEDGRSAARSHDTTQYARLISKMKDASIRRDNYFGDGWGKAITLQGAPSRAGWDAEDIQLALDRTAWQVPSALVERYFEFFEENKTALGFVAAAGTGAVHHARRREYLNYFGQAQDCLRFGQDGPFEVTKQNGMKFMCESVPCTFKDSPVVRGRLIPSLYSVVRFYNTDHLKTDGMAEAAVEALCGTDERRAITAHSLCLHGIVHTIYDDRILLARRRKSLGYDPGTWSISGEEQMDWADVNQETGYLDAQAWVERFVWEEFRVPRSQVKAPRFLSFFLEPHYANVSLCALIQVEADSRSVLERIRENPGDLEFMEFDSVPATREALAQELLNPRGRLHPTSAYRLLKALNHLHGTEGRRALLDAARLAGALED